MSQEAMSSSSKKNNGTDQKNTLSPSSPPPLPPPPSSNHILISNALGSATAGIIARCCTHPLDTAKARLQASVVPQHSPPYKGPIDVLRRTLATEGITGLYRGFGTVIMAGTPGTILYLCSYDWIKTRLSNNQQTFQMMQTSSSESNNNNNNNNHAAMNGNEESFVVHFVSGLLAESLACIIYVPVDVIKERLQVQQRRQAPSNYSNSFSSVSSPSSPPSSPYYYRGGWDALQHILRHEGWSGIYRGYAATLGSFGPFSALYFVFYEHLKTRVRHYLLQHEDASDHHHHSSSSSPLNSSSSPSSLSSPSRALPFQYTVACSALAGATASWLTSPLDMAKLRLQVQRGQLLTTTTTTTTTTSLKTPTNTNHTTVIVIYRGVYDCLHTTYQQSGVRGLFRGAGARVLHFAPATTITMTAYETCRSMIQGSSWLAVVSSSSSSF
jgi:Mitochondrial carrier protein